MLATLRRLLLVSAGAIALSGSGLAQVSADIWQAIGKASDAYARADYVEAARWYRVAADQGDFTAQYFLGSMYYAGEGVPQNDVEAYKWWALAAAQGNADAQKNRDIVRGKMAPAQIAEGQRLAGEWQPRTSASAAEPNAAPKRSAVAPDIESTGSGFFITAAGHLLTNAHVVEGCSQVSLASGARLAVLDIDASSDLALLKTGATSTRAPLSLRQGRGVRLAD